jgi:DHA1 family inner membrane transport protein
VSDAGIDTSRPRVGPALAFMFAGNIVIGSGVLAPAAMSNAMMTDLSVDAVAIGALIGWGAVVLCLGAPAFGFFTNRVDRRYLLAGSLFLYAVGHIASAFAPNYETLLVLRLLMISGAAIFTPQAASAVALMVPEARRAASVALVFMGWAFAGAVAIPLVSIAAEAIDWRPIYVGLGVAAALAGLGVLLLTPRKLYPARMSLSSWGDVLSRPVILILLATTGLQIAGQFTLYPYLAAELRRASGAEAGGVALAFGLYGAAGLVGSIVATRVVGALGPSRTQLACLLCLSAGLAGWSLFSAHFAPTTASIFVWGLGFGAGVSMQQARLISVAPAYASASVALNTSVLYLGQASGSALGGALIDGGSPGLLGPAGLAFTLAAVAASYGAYKRFGA